MVGKTASAGFQIGVRRTFPITLEEAWELLMSPEGLKLWLGETPGFQLAVGHRYETRDGIYGEIRVAKSPQQLRMTWQRPGWDKSTLQIRLYPNSTNGDKTVISFHQEKLKDAMTRETMKGYWETATERILESINRGLE